MMLVAQIKALLGDLTLMLSGPTQLVSKAKMLLLGIILYQTCQISHLCSVHISYIYLSLWVSKITLKMDF